METKEAIIQIPVDKIQRCPMNRPAGSGPDIESLAADIKAHGVTHPVLVRAVDKGYELVDGERRWTASKNIKLEAIPAIVRDYTEAEAYTITLSALLHNKNATPMQEAAAIAHLVDLGKAPAEIAAETGWPISRVARRKQLLNLSEKWRAIAEGKDEDHSKITTEALELVARMESPIQDKIIEKLNWYRGVDAGDIEDSMDKYMFRLSGAPWKLDDADLCPKAGACTACQKRTGLQPDLFGEVSKKGELQVEDKCLDATCWGKKKTAYLEVKISKMRQKNPDAILVKDPYDNFDAFRAPASLGKQALKTYDVQVVKEGTKGAVRAMQINGSKSEFGKEMWVKITERAAQRNPEKAAPTVAQRKAAFQKKRMEAIIDRMNAILEDEDKKQPQAQLIKKMSNRQKLQVSVIFMGGTDDYPEISQIKSTLKKTDAQLLDILAENACHVAADSIDNLTYDQVINPKDVETYSDLFGIDLKTITDQVEKEMPMPKTWDEPVKEEKEEKEAA
jgi:ParB/RepB/Spo0J family partition protein